MSRLRAQLNLFIGWLIFFAAWRLVFLFYHWKRSAQLSIAELAGSFIHGLRLDLSMSAYLAVPVFLLILISYLAHWPGLPKFLRGICYFLVGGISLLQAADLELYQAWGFRMDATPLQYLNHPKELLASTGAAPWFLLTMIWLVMAAAGCRIFHRLLKNWKTGFELNLALKGFLSLFLTVALILPIRGGWQQIPINQSAAYFSNTTFANHAALNLPWNIGYSAWRSEYDQSNPYVFLAPDKAKAIVKSLYPDTGPAESVLTTNRPNVLFIILESYSAGYLQHLGGEPGVTPNTDSLAAQGISFTRMYAGADRSEKGLVALLSGFPNQPLTSVMKQPRKTENLPTLAKSLKKAGYNTSFYYGGEMGFANMRSYLLAGGFDRLVEKRDFNASEYNSKWGVHDHVLFNRLNQELPAQKAPFFTVAFTLSSHEPYDIPEAGEFKGDDEATQFKNSVHYTDKALGDFIRHSKQQPWWKNTLVVLVADHGHRFPGNSEINQEAKFHIPLVFTGGAITKSAQHTLVASQTDIATTLLKQLKLPADDFHWGKDLLHPESKSFAFYSFNNGFGYITEKGYFSYSNDIREVIDRKGELIPEDIETGKAYLQESYTDFLKR